MGKNKEVGEVLWLTLSNGRNNIRMGVVYAPQENKTNVTKLKVMYKGLKEQIKQARNKKQDVLLVGDFNCKIGARIKGNTEEISKGGKLLIDLADKLGLKILNESTACKGLWTRQKKVLNHVEKSVLDYVLVDELDEELVESMVIDEERECTPYHIEDGRHIYTDHRTIQLDIKWNMRHKPGETMRTVINEKNKREFKNKTAEAGLTNIWDKDITIEEKYTEWNNKIKKISEEVFIKKRKKKKEQKEVRILRRRKKEIKARMNYQSTTEEKRIYRERRKLIDEHVLNYKKEEKKARTMEIASKIKSEKGFDGSVFWEFRKRNNGKKAEGMTAIKDEKGEREEDPEKILNIYKNFYIKLLSGKDMTTKEGKETEKIVNKYIEVLERKAVKEGIEPFTKEEYDKVKKELKNGKAPDLQGWRYEFIKNAGKDLDESMLKMINTVVTNNIVPEQWLYLIIKSISKGKGDLLSMDSKRGLFLTNIVSKIAEKLIKNRRKETVEANISNFQCGGVRNRGIGDNHIIVNSAIEEARERKENIYLLFADLQKCFDELWLKDCIKDIVEAGMPAGEAMYIYKMNKMVRAKVDTPIGLTEEFELTEIVRQGTVCAVDLCGVSTDKINRIGLEEPKLVVSGVEIQHPVFVDDMLGIGSAPMIERMEPKMRFLEDTKKFTYNTDEGKSEIMEIQINPKRKEERPIVKVKKGTIGYTDKYKYLGDMYDKTGKNMSKIQSKMGKASFIASEVKREGSYGAVGKADTDVRLLLMEIMVKATLLCSTEAWVNIRREEVESLNRGHYLVLRKVFEQKENTPYYGMLAETGYWPYSFVVVYKKMMYLHLLLNSDEKRIARRIILNQKHGEDSKKNWYNEVNYWIEELELKLEESEITTMLKSEWKKVVKERISKKVREEVTEKLKTTKLRFIEDTERKDYVKECRMGEVREIMKIRLNMTELKPNFCGKYRDRICSACEKEDETTEHVIQCQEYKRLLGHELNCDKPIKELMNNTAWLREAAKVYRRIEETRQWLV